MESNLPDEWEEFECKGVTWEWYSTSDGVHISRTTHHNSNFIVVDQRHGHVSPHLRSPPSWPSRRPYPRIGIGESKWYKPSTWGNADVDKAVGWAMEMIVEHESRGFDPADPSDFIPKECR